MNNTDLKYIGDICYITVHSGAQLVRISDGMCIELSATEYKILSAFIDEKNKALTLNDLARIIWGSNSEKDPNSIKSQITHIRNKLDQIQFGLGKKCIESSKRGFGSYTMKDVYSFSVDIADDGKAIVLPKNSIVKENEILLPSIPKSVLPTRYSLHTNCPSPDLAATQIGGYADEILEVCNQLSKHNNKAALVGMGGVGKSELAKAVAADCAESFKTRLWIYFSGSILRTVIDDNTFSIWGCNRDDYRQDTDRQYFERKMRILKAIADRQVLIILDGFNMIDDPDLEVFLSGEYAVLITTQCQPSAGNLPTFEITHFKDEEKQLALFKKKYKRHIKDAELVDVLEMIRSWQGHTLGICVLADTMRKNLLSPKEMRTLLGDQPDDMKDNSLASKVRRDLQIVFDPNNLSTEERYVMQNLALIAESGISIQNFRQWMQLDDYTIIESLIERSLIVEDSSADSIHLHSMIVDLVLPTLSDSSCCADFVGNIAATCKNAFDCSYMRKLELMGYIQAVYDRTVNLPDIHLTAGMRLGDILEMLGKYDESAAIFKQLRTLTNSGSLQVVIDSKISHGLLLAGKFADGHRVALDGHKSFLTLQKEQIDWQAQRADNWLLQRLCEFYRWIGNYDEAEHYGNDAITMFPSNSKEAAWDIGWSKYHLAYALLLQNKILECKKHLNDAIALFKNIGSEYSSAFAMELLGQANMLEGNYPEALSQTISASNILNKYLEPEHADCGRNWMYQGNIHRRAGNEQEALRCYTKAVNAFRDKHDSKANLVAKLLDNNEIILDLWGKDYQVQSVTQVIG